GHCRHRTHLSFPTRRSSDLINIADVDFSRKGVVSPLGSHYMEDANITAIYGKDNGEPKYSVDDDSFTDIEDPHVLAEAMYEAYLDRKSTRLNSSHVSISYAV